MAVLGGTSITGHAQAKKVATGCNIITVSSTKKDFPKGPSVREFPYEFGKKQTH